MWLCSWKPCGWSGTSSSVHPLKKAKIPYLPEEITVAGCWAHLWRKFDEAVKSLPKGKAKGSSASQRLAYCNLLFGLSRRLGTKLQKNDMKRGWSSQSLLYPRCCCGQIPGQQPYLTNYLKDGRLEISNNRAEGSIKLFVIDRKNFCLPIQGCCWQRNYVQSAPDSH